MNDLLTVHGLGKRFLLHRRHDAKLLTGCADVSFSLKPGEFMGIAGPSGAGKSTIIKCIYRTYLPSEGEIIYRTKDGRDIDLAAAPEREIISLRRSEISYVSQFLKVIPRVPAVDILAEQLAARGWRPDAARERAREYLQMMNIDESLWDTSPVTFSGGEQQRVNLARALITQPRLLLLDEPTASLDAETKKIVVQALLYLKKQGSTMIGVFHDTDAMRRLVDRVFTMTGGRCRSITRMQEVV
jgi:alpha-D-ribose 1-methylphosphonate 5-triphosphate synthase subunit PhnL